MLRPPPRNSKKSISGLCAAVDSNSRPVARFQIAGHQYPPVPLDIDDICTCMYMLPWTTFCCPTHTLSGTLTQAHDPIFHNPLKLVAELAAVQSTSGINRSPPISVPGACIATSAGFSG